MPARLLLPVSLFLNVFLGAAVAVHLLGAPPRSPGPPSPAAIMEEMAATLPAADAALLREAFTANAADLEAADAVMRRMPERIADALARPDFDPGRLREVFAAGRDARARMDAAIEAVLIQAAGRMSPEGRRRLSEWKPPGPPRR